MIKKLKKNFRTDLALEKFGDFEELSNGITKKVVCDDSITITTIDILNEEGAKQLEKEIGTYVTIESEFLNSNDKFIHNKVIEHLAFELKKLLLKHNIGENEEIFVVGLGNRNFTPDTIGVDSLNKILVTKHIYKELNNAYPKVFRPLSALGTGVMGQTGMETANIIKGVLEVNKDVKGVIVIDALASRNMSRLNNTIQLCDTGIAPGSGVNNNRAVLNEAFLGKRVIAIGVPTVIDLKTIIYDVLENISEEKESDDIFKYDDYLFNMESFFVSSKDIDEVAERLKNIIANGINLGVHFGLTVDDINDFML
ncbi:MAG: GPR endopeptidase [Lachnospirales bacterium]